MSLSGYAAALVALALAVSACGAASDRAPEVGTAAPIVRRDPPTPTADTTLRPTAEAESPGGETLREFEPAEGDVYPNAKRLAGRLAQALGTYRAGSSAEEVARAAAAAVGAADESAVLAGLESIVERDSASVGEVEYVQLGGLTPESASLMVVLHQELRPRRGEPFTRVRVLDVRLRIVEGGWVVDGLASDGGSPVEAPENLSAAARAVLDSRRVQLPDSARWDIERGEIDDRLLTLIAEMAERHELKVAVLSSGHPFNVFGTDKQSHHTKGRAVDIYAVDGDPVARQRHEGTPAHALTLWLFDRGVPEVGSPWDLDPPGGRSFTDVVHQDHIHVAVSAPLEGGT